jgi:phage N-6-adenine-methyltransferase
MADSTFIQLRTGASLNRGRSKQDYGTPPEFIDAVRARFGRLDWDLAASTENAVASRFFTEEEDSLKQDWGECSGTLWLNPPFADIEPWARKCSEQRWRREWLLLLTPASVGSNWFAERVFGKALVLFLSPRLQFVGTDSSYPKDLALSCFGFGASGFECWRWRP